MEELSLSQQVSFAAAAVVDVVERRFVSLELFSMLMMALMYLSSIVLD